MLNSCYLPKDMGASAYWKMLPVTNRTTLTNKRKEKQLYKGIDPYLLNYIRALITAKVLFRAF